MKVVESMAFSQNLPGFLLFVDYGNFPPFSSGFQSSMYQLISFPKFNVCSLARSPIFLESDLFLLMFSNSIFLPIYP